MKSSIPIGQGYFTVNRRRQLETPPSKTQTLLPKQNMDPTPKSAASPATQLEEGTQTCVNHFMVFSEMVLEDCQSDKKRGIDRNIYTIDDWIEEILSIRKRINTSVANSVLNDNDADIMEEFECGMRICRVLSNQRLKRKAPSPGDAFTDDDLDEYQQPTWRPRKTKARCRRNNLDEWRPSAKRISPDFNDF